MIHFSASAFYRIIPTLFLIPSTAAQDITASTCVAPNAFQQCYNQAEGFYKICITQAGGNLDKSVACECVLQLNEINCAAVSCWNVVYGCEYQTLARNYVAACANPVPYFPAPDNAPGGCSCNLGYVLYNYTNSAFQYKDCISGNVEQNSACTCCYQAAGYASLYGICPNSNPNLTILAGASTGAEILQVMEPQLASGQCASYFEKYDCADLGFTGYGVPLMTSLDSATFGTQSLSNSNTKTVSSPISGATFTWTDLSLPYTVVAASASGGGKGGSVTTSTTGSSSSGAPAAATGSGSAKSDAGRIISSGWLKTLAAGGLMLIFVL